MNLGKNIFYAVRQKVNTFSPKFSAINFLAAYKRKQFVASYFQDNIFHNFLNNL